MWQVQVSCKKAWGPSLHGVAGHSMPIPHLLHVRVDDMRRCSGRTLGCKRGRGGGMRRGYAIFVPAKVTPYMSGQLPCCFKSMAHIADY